MFFLVVVVEALAGYGTPKKSRKLSQHSNESRRDRQSREICCETTEYFYPPQIGSTELNLTDLAKARSRSASSAKAALAMCPFARRANEWLRGAR